MERRECLGPDQLERRFEIRETRIDELDTQPVERSQIQQKIEGLPGGIRDEVAYWKRCQQMLE
jgi:hypothetical protein